MGIEGQDPGFKEGVTSIPDLNAITVQKFLENPATYVQALLELRGDYSSLSTDVLYTLDAAISNLLGTLNASRTDSGSASDQEKQLSNLSTAIRTALITRKKSEKSENPGPNFEVSLEQRLKALTDLDELIKICETNGEVGDYKRALETISLGSCDV